MTYSKPHRTRTLFRVGAGIVPLLLPAAVLAASADPAPPGVVSHVKVLSDKVQDVSSLEAWKRSFIKPGMTDAQKADAVWRTVVMFRHQEVPPNEFLGEDSHPHDPIKDFNVYGYGQCCCASANVEALARFAGLEARGWGITGHSVPEINVGGRWCMFDASLVNYFKKPDGSVAGVEEAAKSIDEWYARHPGFKGDNEKLVKFMRGDGWKNGPAVLAGGTGYDDNGWLPAATHGWYSSMVEFGDVKSNFPYEYGSAVGYEVNVQLRPGEKLVRNWSNKGLHVNMLEGQSLSVLRADPQDPHGQMRYAPKFGDLTHGRVGNGTLEYDLPLASGAFRGGMLVADNLAARSEDPSGPAVHVKDPAKPATLVFRMPSPYVYLGGQLGFAPVVGAGGSVVASFSDNNGLDWKQIAKAEEGTRAAQKVDLKPLVYRRYDYRLKFELRGKGTGLDAVRVSNDIQHSQRPLPVLDKGENHISFSEGPQEGTITIEGNLNPTAEGAKGKNLSYADFHPQLDKVAEPFLRPQGGAGAFTYPLETPGDVTRLRIGAHYRARDAKDGWTIEASFDGGKTYSAIADLEGPTGIGNSRYVVFDRIPAGSRSALVRFAGRERNTTTMMDLRISADYREPHGGVAPVKVTYAWQENGQEKQDVHVAAAAEESYTIRCADKPVMKSIVLERE